MFGATSSSSHFGVSERYPAGVPKRARAAIHSWIGGPEKTACECAGARRFDRQPLGGTPVDLGRRLPMKTCNDMGRLGNIHISITDSKTGFADNIEFPSKQTVISNLSKRLAYELRVCVCVCVCLAGGVPAPTQSASTLPTLNP